MQDRRVLVLTLAALTLVVLPARARQQTARPGPADTEVWEPAPPVVTPGPETAPTPPPEDAIVLFDGSDLEQWESARDGSPAGWDVHDGVVTVVKSAGDIRTRRVFGDYQLHIEWRIPEDVTGEGQERGNSGLFLSVPGGEVAGYEVQILDSYGNETYVNGMAGAVYKQSIPLVNAARPPGQWQSYDVVWTAPTFAADGALVSPARVTVFWNGVLVQNDFVLQGDTRNTGTPRYHPHGDAPILLQAHGDPSPPISFRDIWVRPLPPAGQR